MAKQTMLNHIAAGVHSKSEASIILLAGSIPQRGFNLLSVDVDIYRADVANTRNVFLVKQCRWKVVIESSKMVTTSGESPDYQ